MEKKALIIITFGLFMYAFAFSQENDMGDDPERCRINLSTYTEFVNQGNLQDARRAWSWCFNNCPAATRNIYIHGVTIMEHFIENAENEEKKQAYIDTLMMVFDQRIEYFQQEALVLGRKALALLKHRPTEVVEAYNILEAAYEAGGNQTATHIIGYYMNLAVVLLDNDIIDAETVVNLYSDLTESLEFQIAALADENEINRVKEVKDRVQDFFVNSSAADCETIIELFGPKLKENPEDVELAQEIINLLDAGDGENCKGDLYLKAAVIVYNDEKTARAAHSIAQSYFRRNEPNKAEKFYKEAAEMEEDEMRKADIYYELGLMYFSQLNQWQNARAMARNAISHNPNHGRAHILIGRVYARGGRECNFEGFDRKAMWWVVVDQLERARRVDPNVADDANDLIRRYSENFPSQEEGFWENIEEGEKYTIGCWINETTRVRYLN